MILHRRLSLAAALLLWVIPGVSRAETLKVGSPNLLTIQAAVDAALANSDANDTVAIPAGLYDETVSITLTGSNAQESLTLKRSGTGTVIVRGLAGAAAIAISEISGVSLKNLVVQSGTLAGGGSDDDVAAIDVSGATADVVIEGCTGVPGDDVGVDLRGTAVRGVKIKSSNFSGLSRIAFRIDGSDHTLDTCLANGNGHNGYLLLETSENCRVKASTGLGLGTGDIAEPGYFTIRGRGHEVEDCDSTAGRDGFYVAGSGHRFTDVTSSLHAQSAFACVATDSVFSGCEGTFSIVGFSGGGVGVLIDTSRFDSNSSHGVFVTVDRTKVVGSTAELNGGSGIYVLANVVRSHLRDNKAKSNGGEGIFVDGDESWVENNVAALGDGLVDSGTGNAGRGNTAKNGATNDFP